MGFWRGVGYFFSVIMIILGFWIFITGFLHFSVYPFPPLFRLGLGSILAILGFVFIWMLRRSAGQERIEKQLKEINERDKERSLREIADRDKDPIYQQQKYQEELEEARRKLEADEKYLAELERKKDKKNL